MARQKLADLVAKTMSPDSQARAKARTERLIAEMPLDELRHARKLSQTRLAEIMETTQPEISKIEHRTDLYLSTLRSYIEAMGGALEVVARFPDGVVKISQFHEDDDAQLARAHS